jgi:hypothetical protein
VRKRIMKMEFKKLTENELGTFINIRINHLREEGAKEDFDLRPALMACDRRWRDNRHKRNVHC